MYLQSVPIDKIGSIRGRGALVVTSVKAMDRLKYEITFSAAVRLCKIKPDYPKPFFDLVCIFDKLLFFQICSDEMAGAIRSEEYYDMFDSSESDASIEEIIDSDLVLMNDNKRGFHGLRHIYITAYDNIVEVVCTDFQIQLPL